ncbi:hypothetical protein J2X83_004943 [Brevibacillus nitrificans]|nr:hypothetical protein [Brevibacillus nitrificans]
MKLFVGIDVSSEELEACFMNPEGDTLETFTVKNDLYGASHLRDRIVAASDKLSSSEIHIGLEATSVYSWHPAMFLHEDVSLRQRKAKVFTINPKLIHKFREAYADLDKTDRIDAWIIADRLRFGRLTTTIVMQEQYLALQRLTRMRFHLVHNLTREKQYFLQNLFYKCNAFRSEVDSSVFGHAIMEMLSEKYSLDEIANMEVADLANYLKEKGKNRFPDPDHVARCIQKAAQASYRLSKVVEDSIDIVLGTSIQAIRSIQSQLKEIDKAIERILEGISAQNVSVRFQASIWFTPPVFWRRSATLIASTIKPLWPNTLVLRGASTNPARLKPKIPSEFVPVTGSCGITWLKLPTQ